MSEKLKPCPFCGSEGYVTVDLRHKPHRYNVKCEQNLSQYPTCHFRPHNQGWHDINGFHKEYKTEEQAIKAWNTRTFLETEIEVDVDKIKELVDICKEKLRLQFCMYDYQTDKRKWLHPDNVCLPNVMKKPIEELEQAIAQQLPKLIKGKKNEK